jgi:aromatase
VCFSPERIIYKQTVTPRLLAAHTGSWTIELVGDGLVVTSHHSVLLRREAIAEVLGAETTVAQARTAVREAVGTNSRTTLEHAKSFVEASRA